MWIDSEEMEEIIVYPPPIPTTGTSIYNRNTIIKMGKLMASWGNSIATTLGRTHMFLSATWGSVSVASPPSAVITGPLTAGHASAAQLSNVAAWGYGHLAAHPPRSNYKVELCEGGIIATLPKIPDELPETKRTIALLNETAAYVRRFWDAAELWEGAVLAEDGPWTQTHYENCVQNYRGLYAGMSQLAVATDRCFHESASALQRVGDYSDIRDVFEKKYLGKAYSSIPEFGKVVSLIQKSPCAQDIEMEYWKDLASRKITDYSSVQLRLLVDEIHRFSKELNLPV